VSVFFFSSCFEIKDSRTQRQTGRQAQLSNISAAKAVADIIRTTLGPRSMLKVRFRSILFPFIPSDYFQKKSSTTLIFPC